MDAAKDTPNPEETASPTAAASQAEPAAQAEGAAALAEPAAPAANAAPYMQNRELSWLTFNERVLDQGADETVPLLERLNFVSIFWSNLQEFFMVRVGSLTDLSLVKKHIVDSKSGMTPSEQLDAIYARCHELYPIQERTFEEVRRLLGERGVRHLRPNELDDEQRAWLAAYVHDNVMPFLSPQIINARHPFPHLENGALYVVVRLNDEAERQRKKEAAKAKADKDGKADKAAVKEAKKAKNLGAEGVTLGLVPMPRQCERVIALPGKGKELAFVLLEHAIEMVAAEIFSMYTVKHTNVICITRNADLDATEGSDEADEDYREHMKRILKKRSRLAPVRLESERPLSTTLEKLLLARLNLRPHQVFSTSVPLDLGYTFALASRLPAKERAALTNPPFSPQWPACLDRNRSLIEQVTERETLLSYPYESMDPFVQLLREAANDPAVISIKITLYRLASQSHLAEALIAAAENGKEVTALFELRARFDESNNIEWSQRFEQAGCKVIYGFRDFKVHSKICCITRQTDSGLQHITQLGTGNYNEKTAKLYTDLSFITCDATFGRDAVEFFRNMGLENTSDNYDICLLYTSVAGMPAARARSMPYASGRDDTTRTMSTGSPSPAASMIACKFVPLPESSTPILSGSAMALRLRAGVVPVELAVVRVAHRALAGNDAAHAVRGLAGLGQGCLHLAGASGVDDQDHAQAHVERLQRLRLVEVRGAAHEPRDGRHGPRAQIHLGVAGLRQRAVQVLGDAAARDVRQRAHGAGAGVQHGAHGLHVDARGREQGVLQARAVQLLALEAQLVVGLALHAHLAGERVAVGVQAARRQADQHVSLAHGRGVEHLRPVHHAHAEAGQVVVVRVHHAGVLGHLAADERAAGLLAALADARHDLGHVLGLELADGHVVQEEQRLGARGQDVVRAHRCV